MFSTCRGKHVATECGIALPLSSLRTGIMPRPRQRHPRGHMVSALLAIVYGVRPPPVNGTMQCVGTQALDRACLLQDLYYDTQERTFTYYGKTIANDTQKGGTVKADTDTFDSATYAPARGTCVCHATVHALLALRVDWP